MTTKKTAVKKAAPKKYEALLPAVRKRGYKFIITCSKTGSSCTISYVTSKNEAAYRMSQRGWRKPGKLVYSPIAAKKYLKK